MKCPTCGAENEASNRFCEQCGSRITPSGEFQPAPADLAALPTAAGPTCPSCGAAVLPGEAFCDECGASLTSVAPAVLASVPSDAPTMFAAPPPSAGAPASGDQGVTCQSCGHQNLPGDRFCDNCGADLAAPAAPAAAPTPAAATTPAADAPTILASPQELQAAAAPTVEQPAVPTADPAPAEAPIAAATADAPTETAPAAPEPPAAAPADPQAQYAAEQQRLGDEIARQQQIIAQFEQMQAMFGAATPPAVTQGLADARDAKARADADLAALQPPAPAVDPAEVARLTEEAARQQQIIAQFEQMQAMFGAATPPAVTQGLADARDAKARAEADLAALTGAAAAPAPAPTAEAPAPLAEPPAVAPAPTAEAPAASAPAAAPAEPSAPVAPPPPPPPAAARLVFDGSKELALPADKREIIIGREDPISGIFPEVDLTPYGGESGGVSRQHARLNNDGGQWTLTDLNSTNYTRVDGAKIEPNVPTPISSGAKLQFGRVALIFQA